MTQHNVTRSAVEHAQDGLKRARLSVRFMQHNIYSQRSPRHITLGSVLNPRTDARFGRQSFQLLRKRAVQPPMLRRHPLYPTADRSPARFVVSHFILGDGGARLDGAAIAEPDARPVRHSRGLYRNRNLSLLPSPLTSPTPAVAASRTDDCVAGKVTTDG